KTPALVQQELWGMLLAYNLLRFMMCQMAYSLNTVMPCSGQLKLATVLEFSQYNRSDSLGVKPPLY
ncbi:hypothetical protein Q5N55_18295, partial [Vibrio cholerae]|nr:hypothetical protein [Vibrio cholerae]